ncbi:hypothetical protein [Paenibacillus sp. CMAA1364]
MTYIWLLVAVLIIIMILVIRMLRIKKKNHNVIKFQKKSNNPNLQRCSYCKRMSKLTFYASDEGTIVGVCKECKSKADARDMLPI